MITKKNGGLFLVFFEIFVSWWFIRVKGFQ